MTFDQANQIHTKRLCPVCIGELEKDNNIVQPTREQRFDPSKDRWEPGICQRCGQQRRMTKERRDIFNYEGFRERGLERG